MGGQYHWVSSGEVAWDRITSTAEKITETGLAKSSTCLHPEGTILLGMIGEGKTRGQAAILDIQACNNQNSAAIRVSLTEIPPDYIFYYLQYQYERTRRDSMGNNQPALNKSKVESIKIPLMPLKELHLLIEVIERLLTPFDSVQHRIDEMSSQLSTFDKTILSKAFLGELVPQDPADEPASVLLERIQQVKAHQEDEQVEKTKQRGRKKKA